MPADSTDTPLDLVTGFPEPSHEEWLNRVEKTLKGADFEKRLVSRTYDDIDIQPLYVPDGEAHDSGWPGLAPFTRGARPLAPVPTPWSIAQAHAHPDPTDANAAILNDLTNGVTGLVLRISEAPDTPGMQIFTLDELDRALDGVYLQELPVALDAGLRAPETAALLTALWEWRGIAPEKRTSSFGIDPIGTLARTGRLPGGMDGWMSLVHDIVSTSGVWSVSPMSVDTRAYHFSGASEAQELAFALATGVSYLRAMEALRIPLTTAARQIHFILVADADIFITIAKLRAVRAGWSRVLAACGIRPEPMALSAETATRMMTRRDPWVNMLRVTAAAFAAGVGGASSVTVAPHTASVGLPDGFARRIARNTQLILQEESAIGRVADAAGGSAFIETLTGDLLGKAWEIFQAVEAAGGMLNAVMDGMVGSVIDAVAERRNRDIARRKLPITGISTFPKLDEAAPSLSRAETVRCYEPAVETREARRWGGLCAAALDGTLPVKAWGGEDLVCTPLPRRPLADAFEALRDISDAHLGRTGARPRLFLANLGRVAAFNARATWTRNVFEAGGIEAVMGAGYDTAEEAAEAFAGSGAALVAICSSDEVYGKLAEPAATALKAKGAQHVFLAGHPGEVEANLRNAGVDSFVFEGCDVLAILQAAYDTLEIKIQ